MNRPVLMAPLHKIAWILAALVLLPALVYVAGRVHSLNENEALLGEIYDQQLQTMLFAVDQYAWDVTRSWAGRLERLPVPTPEAEVQAFLEATPTVQAVFWADTLLQAVRWIARDEPARTVSPEAAALEPALVRRLLARQKLGYQQLAPLTLATSEAGPTVALVFAAEGSPPRLAGLVLDAAPFVGEVLAPKLEEVARGRFVLGVFGPGTEAPLYATAPLQRADLRHTRALWLFDDYELGIRLSGATVEEVIRARFRRDLGLIGLLALVLVGGAWMLYRNVRREVELARIKSDFVANVSHELRTPLALIRMYAETLELGRLASEAQRQAYYQIISEETQRLTRLVNNILNFSHIESGRKQYQFAPVALNPMVEEVMERYRFTLDQQGFRVEMDLAEALPPVRADAEAIAEALINLIDNAVKYSEADKYVRVSTGRAADGIFVEVADHGIGIAPEDQDRIFDAFYRASSSLVHDTQGTGLGLALVRHIAEAHGGAVRVQSRAGQGSRFRLTFPAAPVEAAPSLSTPVLQTDA